MAKSPQRVTHRVSSLAEYLEVAISLPKLKKGFYAYRGAGNIDWEDLPGIMRPGREALLERERDAIRDLIAIHPQEFAADTSMFDRLVRMQHFNLPTRLLDVTANPLVALYFATDLGQDSEKLNTDGKVIYINVSNGRRKYFDSDTISCISNLANLSQDEKSEIFEYEDGPLQDFNDLASVARLLQFIRSEKPYFLPRIRRDDLNRIWYVSPKLSNRRIIAQVGAFLIFGSKNFRRPTENESKIVMKEILIQKEAKERIQRELQILGVNESSLFPEIDRASGYIVRNYEGP